MVINVTSIGTMPVWWPDDIGVGILFCLLGVCGAAIMVFIGEWDKLMGKSARIVELEDEIRKKREIADKLKEDKTGDRKDWEQMINAGEDRLDRERWRNLSMGIILYLFIGGVIAAILANGMIEAVAFGAGWTGFLGIFGLKKDSEKRAATREEESRKQDEDFTKELGEMYYDGYRDGYLRGYKRL